MKYSTFYFKGFLLSISMLLMLSACLQFRPISLYDREAKAPIPPPPDDLEKVVSTVLYEDDTLNVWGILGNSCKTFELSEEVKYAGKASLKLDWEREGCEWVGFGIGWDDYAGKNLEPVLEYAAFQMYVRTQKGKAYGLPLVFTLEDYSEVMAFCYTANRYFERVAIDEEWQKVIVPLKAFDDEGEGIDYTNIKQLQIEMQQSGSVYIDEISLVFYEEPVNEPWLVEEKIPDPTRLPQTLFDDEFVNQNGWGLVSNDCMKVERDRAPYAGDFSIHADWDFNTSACALPFFGVSWAKWNPVNIEPMVNKAELSFFLKSPKIEDLKFQILLEDFNRNTDGVNWKKEWIIGSDKGWNEVRIPLSDLIVGEVGSLVATANASNGSATSSFRAKLDHKIIKSLVFKLQGEGEMWIDNLSWIEKND